MKLCYPVRIGGTGGPTRGYRAVSENLQAALQTQGVTWDDEAPIALHVSPPHLFEPLLGRVNVLLTMFETDQIPGELVYQISRADLILVPCRHNQTILRWAGIRRPIRVVPLAVGAAHAAPVPPRPAHPFRFLWVGQAQVRKGWQLVGAAFEAAFPHRRDVEFVMKTVSSAGSHHHFRTGTGRVSILAEAFTDEQMVALYRAAHVFVFPSYGEGWGLPVLEAMAAECLVLAPSHTGLAEFFDARVGWVLPWHRVAATYGVPVTAYEPDGDALVQAMRTAVTEWSRVPPIDRRNLGLRQRARTRALTFTWEQTARGVLAAITDQWAAGRAA